MARLLFILIAIGVVVAVIKRVAGLHRQRSVDRTTERHPRFEKTEKCARCGSYLPASLTRESAAGQICRDGCADHADDNSRAS